MADAEPIAVIGMAGRFPGADGIEEFWENLLKGRDCLTTLTDEELLAWGERPGNLDDSYVRKRPVLRGADTFDERYFGMTPRETELRDPQYRVMLEVTHAALEHSGYDPSRYQGAIGLYAGTNMNRYRYDYIEENIELLKSVGLLSVDVSNNADYMSTFISYKLGLRGPSMTVLTACSTSLVAVHLACGSLRSGDSTIAVAGGVDLEYPLNRGYTYLPGGIAAKDGTPRPFDQHATGTNFGCGAGAVVLKPLAAALSDGDRVYAVIRGSAINNDGDRKPGYTAPSVTGQSECIQKALRAADVDPRTIGMVEAHGTATPVGDPIELAGITDAFQRVAGGDLPHGYCAIGSVKSNIGHLGQGAGVAGLIKAALALHHRTIPASIHVTEPNSAFDWGTSPFRVAAETGPWAADGDLPRRAAVSSFGIGGTNAHLVLEEAPRTEPAPWRPTREVVPWSAVDDTAFEQLRERLAGHFGGLADDDPRRFADSAHTLRVGRTPKAVRGAVVAADAADAVRALGDPLRVIRDDGVSRRIVFGFPGQGTRLPGAFTDLYDQVPVFRRGCDAAFDVLAPLLDHDLRRLWREGDAAELAETSVAQPLLYVLEYTLGHCLMHWGAAPAAVFGHSLGELAAAAIAGVFDFESGLRAVAARAALMQSMPRGDMLAVNATADEVGDLLGGPVALAAVNGERQVVLSGPAEAIGEAAARLRDLRIGTRPLRTSHAFHSPAMGEAAAGFADVLSEMTLHAPTTTLFSAATGRLVTAEEAASPRFWADQLTAPVQFDQAAAAVLADGPATVVEVGPGRTVSALLRSRPDLRASQSRVWPLTAGEDGSTALEELLAGLWVAGEPVDCDFRADGKDYRRVAVPGYPYQRRRHWVAAPKSRRSGTATVPSPASGAASGAVSPSAAGATGKAEEVPGEWSMGAVEWVCDTDARPAGSVAALNSGTALVITPKALERRTRAMVGMAGYRAVTVTTDDLDPTDMRAWRGLLDRASDGGDVPDVIVHGLLLDIASTTDRECLAEHLDSGVHSLHAAVGAIAGWQRRHRTNPTLVLLGRYQVDISGGEPLNAAAAGAQALLRSAAHELPGLSTVCVDVSPGTPEDVVARELAALSAPLVALRGTARWLPRLCPLPKPAPGSQPRLRRRGTYLVTGGMRGIGLVAARAIADTGLRPRLGLLGRSGPPSEESADGRALHAAIESFAAADAEVELLTADVNDLDSLRAAVETLERRFGPIHGVLHAAGVPGGGLAERRTGDEMREVLAPKTLGLLNIEEVFAGRDELDLLVAFSSQAGLAGLYGSADYAAGNAFLDAHARKSQGRERVTLSIQWPGWSEVGMAARSSAGLAALTGAAVQSPGAATPSPGAAPADDTDEPAMLTRTYTPGESWELDEHVFDGTPVLPGAALLELALDAAREKFGADCPVRLSDVVLLTPVVGEPDGVTTRVLVTEAAGMTRLRIQSRPRGSSRGWTDHCAGTAALAEPVSSPDIDALWEKLPPADRGGKADWMEFGPRWPDAVESRGTELERIIRFELDPAYADDLARHAMHPAIVDAATGVLVDAEPGKKYAPFLYRRVTFLRPLTARVTVHARLREDGRRPRPSDLDLYDTDTGELLAAFSGFTVREVTGHKFGGSNGAGRTTTAPARRPAAVEPKVPRDDARTGLLAPRDGAAALLALLAAEVPPVVLVDAPGARLRVPGIPWTGRGALGAGDRETAPAANAGSAPPAETVRVPERAVEAEPAPASASTAAPAVGAARTGPPADATAADAIAWFWSDALGVADIGHDDDFFEIGGDSLAAVTLIDWINQHFGTELAPGVLFEHTTIRSLAAAVAGR